MTGQIVESFECKSILHDLTVVIKNTVIAEETPVGLGYSIPYLEELSHTVALWRLTWPERLSLRELRGVLSTTEFHATRRLNGNLFYVGSFERLWEKCTASDEHERLFRATCALIIEPMVLVPMSNVNLFEMELVERRKGQIYVEAERVHFISGEGRTFGWQVRPL